MSNYQNNFISFRLHKLLIGVKATVEGLLATQSTNVWSTYGGLDRLCNNVEAVLMHQIILDQVCYNGLPLSVACMFMFFMS